MRAPVPEGVLELSGPTAENDLNTAVLPTRHIAFPVVYCIRQQYVSWMLKFEGMMHLSPKGSMTGNML